MRGMTSGDRRGFRGMTSGDRRGFRGMTSGDKRGKMRGRISGTQPQKNKTRSSNNVTMIQFVLSLS
jgi:hypothetical protein